MHIFRYLRLTTVTVTHFSMSDSGSDSKESACKVRDPGSVPGLGRFPGGRNGNPLQCQDELKGGFLCAILDLSGNLWPLLIPEYSGIKKRGMPLPGLKNPGISFVSFSLW